MYLFILDLRETLVVYQCLIARESSVKVNICLECKLVV